MRIDVRKGERLTPEQVIRLGDEAAQLVNDETLNTFFDMTEDAIIREWGVAKTVEERENAWGAMQGLMRLMKQMEIAMQRAKAVRETRDKKEKRSGGNA